MRYMIAFLGALLVPVFAYALVDINTASVAELDTLPGIGPTLAQRIVDYRTANGPFATTAEIKNVSGIGESTYNNLKDLITVSSGSTPPQSPPADEGATTTAAAATVSTPVYAPVPSYVPPPTPTLFADAGEDRTVIVGAHVEYEGRAYNIDKEYVENARFHWNFGDGATAEGASVLHHFEYPGTYVVVLSVARDRESVSDKIVVRAEPAQLGFTVSPDGSVAIENRSVRDIDLSKWVVRAFLREFLLPEDTIVLAGSSIRISPKLLGFFAGLEAELAYPNGALALKANQATASTEVQAAPQPQAQPGNIAAVPSAAASRVVQEVHATDSVPEDDSSAATATPLVASVAAARQAPSGTYWWLGAFALAGLTGASAVAFRRMKSKKWEVIDG